MALHFGFRARDECVRLQWGDKAVEDEKVSGKQVFVWKAEGGSKTRQGDGHCRAFSPKANSTNTRRCPVCNYLNFASDRPDKIKKPVAPFFLAVNHSRAPGNPIWYNRAPLGKNKIGEFLTRAAKNAGLPGNVTNHSVRKTCISRLMDAEVPVNYVAQLSGHKNLKSLDSYKTASDEQQPKMSLVLSSGKKKSPTFSNDAPVGKPAVKPWELERPLRQQKGKLLWAKSTASLAFSLVQTSEASRDAHLIFHSIAHLAAVAKTAISQSSENATLLFQMTLIQIKSQFPQDSYLSNPSPVKRVFSR